MNIDESVIGMKSVLGMKTRSMKVYQKQHEMKPKRVYTHISKETKAKLIHTVLRQKCKIKKIAKDLNINYATAKTILHCHKKKQINMDEYSESKRAGCTLNKNDSKLYVQIKVGEKVIHQYEYFEAIKRTP
ncbi:unnamed protein product (macronuclear) [Paramecium tetraurelia]|uniref:HTH psq-type domain-containing protein n=1 Tax=Paramecium tetraurelia TaxID=5888 RepID=A0BVJ2_PARTE|nr:uncharacterized protein GSPATT00005805001 [Paramecium tetraurelia]CAK62559.1 unnamed protein product [Paramecium tetraurelia]|eukprot:XP_001429957.1 hypothetical protein (macronuclear) [Paramecium tetraurelia strain d4-2]